MSLPVFMRELQRHNETTLFLVGVSFALMFVDETFRRDFAAFFIKTFAADPVISVIFGGFLVWGAMLIGYHAFSNKKKRTDAKDGMLLFLFAVNMFVAATALFHITQEREVWQILFPVWNIVGALAFIRGLQRSTRSPYQFISDEESTAAGLMIGTGAVAAACFAGLFLLNMHWSVVFSLATALATTLPLPQRETPHVA